MIFLVNTCVLLIIALAMIVTLLVLKIPIWIVFIVVSLTTLTLSNQINYIGETIHRLLTDHSTWDLVLALFLIAIFVNLYRKTGFVDKLGEELVLFIKKPRLVSMITPAVLGLLPVPGGALMSAPVVDSVGEKLGLDNEKKLYVNVWFRHVIFVVYPLSTVLVLTAVLTNQNLWSIITKQIPVALIMITAGYIIGFKKVSSIKYHEEKHISFKERNLLIKVSTPLVSAIAVSIALSPFIDNKPYFYLTRLSITIGVLVGIVLLILFSKTSMIELLSIAKSREVVELVLIGLTSMYLRVVYSTLDFKCLYNLVSTLNPVFILITIPIFFSLIGGLPTSSVVLSIPIVSSIVEINLEYASLIYLSAFLGYLLSPLHLCYIYSAQYFKVPLIKGYKYLIPSIIITLLITIVIYKIT